MNKHIVPPAELPTIIGRGKHASGNFAGWRRDSQRAAVAFARRAEAWKFKRDLKDSLRYTVAPVRKLAAPGKVYTGQWIVVIENAAIPADAPDRFFGSIVAADVRMQTALAGVQHGR
jgi:hypothetical protein